MMARRKTPLKIPFDANGNLMSHVGYTDPEDGNCPHIKYRWEGNKRIEIGRGEWRDNYEFKAILVFDRTERGRSAAHFILYDEEGHQYQMFMTDALDLLKRVPNIAYGHVEGIWTFCKRGANYGVRFVA